MPTEYAIIIAVGSFILTSSGFYLSWITTAKSETTNLTRMRTNIDYIKISIQEIKDTLRAADRDNAESIKRLHKWLGDHEREYHKKN